MLVEKIDFLEQKVNSQQRGNKALLIHVYLRLLEESMIAGNIFLNRVTTREKERLSADNFGT